MFALKIQEWWVNILQQTTGGSWGSDCHSPGDSGCVCFWVWVIFLGFVSGSVFVLVLLSCSWWLSSTSLSSVFLFVVSLVSVSFPQSQFQAHVCCLRLPICHASCFILIVLVQCAFASPLSRCVRFVPVVFPSVPHPLFVVMFSIFAVRSW